MATNDWQASEDQLKIAMSGLTIQAEAHGLDLSDENVQAFIKHVAGNIADNDAHNLFLYGIIHKDMGINEEQQ
jgi:hypothetical protein